MTDDAILLSFLIFLLCNGNFKSSQIFATCRQACYDLLKWPPHSKSARFAVRPKFSKPLANLRQPRISHATHHASYCSQQQHLCHTSQWQSCEFKPTNTTIKQYGLCSLKKIWKEGIRRWFFGSAESFEFLVEHPTWMTPSIDNQQLLIGFFASSVFSGWLMPKPDVQGDHSWSFCCERRHLMVLLLKASRAWPASVDDWLPCDKNSLRPHGKWWRCNGIFQCLLENLLFAVVTRHQQKFANQN